MKRETPRQDELCKIIAEQFGGRAPSKSAAYLRLQYPGGESNLYGSFTMNRAIASGLIRECGSEGKAIPVELTESGWARVGGRPAKAKADRDRLVRRLFAAELAAGATAREIEAAASEAEAYGLSICAHDLMLSAQDVERAREHAERYVRALS